jgi:CRP-like cAMP-binding protein
MLELVARRRHSNGAARAVPAFEARAFSDAVGGTRTITQFARGETIFTQGDACEHVMYIQAGGVKVSVLSKAGKEAVLAVLGPGDFFGEECLAGQPFRTGNATAITPSAIVFVGKEKMVRLLHSQHAMSDRFISHMLSLNIRIEEDLLDQLLNSSEKRLARTLLLLAGYGRQRNPVHVVPDISRETLANMAGMSQSRANFFLSKFNKLGFIDYDGELSENASTLSLKVNSSLLSVVLHE